MYHNISVHIMTAPVALCLYASQALAYTVGAGKATATDLSF